MLALHRASLITYGGASPKITADEVTMALCLFAQYITFLCVTKKIHVLTRYNSVSYFGVNFFCDHSRNVVIISFSTSKDQHSNCRYTAEPQSLTTLVGPFLASLPTQIQSLFVLTPSFNRSTTLTTLDTHIQNINPAGLSTDPVYQLLVQMPQTDAWVSIELNKYIPFLKLIIDVVDM